MILTLDHTQRACWQNCQRYYLFRHMCGFRKMTPDAAGLEFGKAFHRATEVVDLTGDIELAMSGFKDDFNFPDDTVRTLTRAREMLKNYQDYVKKHNWTFIQQAENTLEISFCLPFNSNVNYAGRCDRELTNGAIGEWKTAYYLYDSNGNPMPYLQQWWGHNSIRGYAWAKGASKAILLGMGVYPQRKKGGFPYSGIEHLVISIEDWEIEEFKRDMTLISEQILEAYSKHNLEPGCFESNLNRMFQDKLYRHFPTNTSKCYYFKNTCQFKDLCTRDCPKGLYENYYIIDPFEPWKEEE